MRTRCSELNFFELRFVPNATHFLSSSLLNMRKRTVREIVLEGHFRELDFSFVKNQSFCPDTVVGEDKLSTKRNGGKHRMHWESKTLFISNCKLVPFTNRECTVVVSQTEKTELCIQMALKQNRITKDVSLAEKGSPTLNNFIKMWVVLGAPWTGLSPCAPSRSGASSAV